MAREESRVHEEHVAGRVEEPAERRHARGEEDRRHPEPPDHRQAHVGEEEAEGRGEGALEKGERKMIYSIFQFGDTLAREIMIPRIDIYALEISHTLAEAVQALSQSGHSRVPVYEETIDQIVSLSIRFGIVTPYTSYLVTEDQALGAEARQRIVQDQYSKLLNQAPAPASGQEAVRKSADEASMAGAESIQVQPAEAAGRVKAVGPRTFLLTEDKWVDTGFDPQSMQPVRVAFLSDDYFRLLEVFPDLSAAFALGPKVIALADGVAYEVVAEGTEVVPLQIITLTPPTLEPGLAPTLPIQSTPAPDQPTEAETQAAPTQTFSPAATIQPAGQPAAEAVPDFSSEPRG